MTATPFLSAVGVMMVLILVWGSVWREEIMAPLQKLQMLQLTSVQWTVGTL